MKNKEFRATGIIIAVTYLVLIVVLLFNFFGFKTMYHDQEMKMIVEIEQKIRSILETNDHEFITEQLQQVVSDYPLDLVVKQQEGAVFSSIPYVDGENLLSRTNPSQVLREAQGDIELGNTKYYLWYNIYHQSDSQFLNEFMKSQMFVMFVLVILLLTIIIILRKILLKPLETLKKNIKSFSEYSFEDINKSDDVINESFYKISSELEDDLTVASRRYTELEKALQASRVHLQDSLVVGQSMVHDLKTPIHRNILENEIVLKESGIEEVKELAEFNIELNEIVMSEVNETLEFLKYSRENVKDSHKEIVLEHEITRALSRFSTNISTKDLSVEILSDDNTVLDIDSNGFTLLLHNILSNMIQYSLNHETITIEVHSDIDNATIVFTNKSNPQNINRLNRSDNLFNSIKDQTNKYSSGNGLFLIKNLTSMLNGSFDLNTGDEHVKMTVNLRRGINNEQSNINT